MTIESLKKVVLVLCAAVVVQVLFSAYLLVKWDRFVFEEEGCCECTAEVELPEEHFPFVGYYSVDRKIAIEMPKWDASVTVDGKILYPVVVHYQEFDGDRIVTNMCCETDRGTCGNYKVETVDGGFSLTDSSWGNCGDSDAVYTHMNLKDDKGNEVMVPLELLGLKREVEK